MCTPLELWISFAQQWISTTFLITQTLSSYQQHIYMYLWTFYITYFVLSCIYFPLSLFKVLHELLSLEILTLLLEDPTGDSVEVAIGFLKECGMKLTELSPRGIHGK